MIGPLTIVSLDQGRIYRQEPVKPEPDMGGLAEAPAAAPAVRQGRLARFIAALSVMVLRRPAV